MAFRPTYLGSGLAFVLVLALAASMATAQDAPDVPDEAQGPVDGLQGVEPPQVSQAVEDAKDGLNQNLQGQGSTGNAPKSPLGGENGVEGGIAEGVVNVIMEHPVAAAATFAGISFTIAAGFWLASRYIDPTVALQSPERSMLYGFVKGNPGVHLKQLSTEFSMKTSTVLWHVRKLESADLIRSKKANGYRVFYPVSGGMEASKVSEAVTALSNVNARSLFAFLAENPEAALRDLSDRLHINGGTVRWHLKKLRAAGLLEEIGHTTRVTDLGVKAWNQVQGNPAMQIPVAPLAGEADSAINIEAEALSVRNE